MVLMLVADRKRRGVRMSWMAFMAFVNVTWTKTEKMTVRTTLQFACLARTHFIGNAYVSGCITIRNVQFAGWISMHHRISIIYVGTLAIVMCEVVFPVEKSRIRLIDIFR